ncbi:response regulator [Butyrivibrio sp. JL13D10]|uniref:response regulator n=1 Tax=Butyrivibrio sp. JL13D10 TaxID=3236815 RepID=UPI0038B4C744
MSSVSIGTKLKNLRLKKGLTQKELAKLLFVTARCIGNWEADRRKPDINSLSLLSNIFDVDADYFLDSSIPDVSSSEVIVVDDDRLMLNNYVKLISGVLTNVEVTGFEDASSAYKYGEEHLVSIAFINIELFGEDGPSLARSLINLNPKINIIFLTGNPEHAVKALDIFCSGYLMKPLTRMKVKDQIKHLRFQIANIL